MPFFVVTHETRAYEVYIIEAESVDDLDYEDIVERAEYIGNRTRDTGNITFETSFEKEEVARSFAYLNID